MHRLSLLLLALPCSAFAQVPEKAAPVKAVRVFEELRFDRPIVVTHDGEHANRIYVAEQKGRVVSFEKDPDVEEFDVVLDIRDKVAYADKMNEEGLLGLAFHPKFSENGHVFLYYTLKGAGHVSLISRFTSKDGGQSIDPASETEVMRVEQPFWNHNGGTIAFGPDGYLYVGLGDGGSGGDPKGNGQNLGTLLGSILRIDVDNPSKGKGYGIPKDNPFVEGNVFIPREARPEIWAYGLRNVWRMSFDRETGRLWAADVGQNLWEEINVIEKGGNYGWNVREALRPFNSKTPKERPVFDSPSPNGMIDPVFAYHHDVGKSITGGHVYRGKSLPALVGKYVYADYVTGLIWALEYDEATGRATANNTVEGPKLPVMSFGEDADGELYFTTTFGLLYGFEGK